MQTRIHNNHFNIINGENVEIINLPNVEILFFKSH